MKNDSVPDELHNNEPETMADNQCDMCGEESSYGTRGDGGRWFCHPCYLESEPEVMKVEQSAICECGNQTNLKKSHLSQISAYICPRCLEVFSAEPCPECGELCAIEHTLGGFSGCRQCLEEGREGGQ